MKRLLIVAVSLIVMLAGLAACNITSSTPPTPTPTLVPHIQPTPTTVPTVLPPTPTAIPPTVPPTETPVPPTETPIPPTAAPTSAGIDHVKIFMVAVGDNGASGDLIGCGDSIVGVDRQITPTLAPLRAALEQLLSLHDEIYSMYDLRNALYQSNLTVGDITIDDNGKATIMLAGTLLSGGVCDDPRIIAQLTYTAKQFSTVKDAAIYVNGTLIQDLLSGK